MKQEAASENNEQITALKLSQLNAETWNDIIKTYGEMDGRAPQIVPSWENIKKQLESRDVALRFGSSRLGTQNSKLRIRRERALLGGDWELKVFFSPNVEAEREEDGQQAKKDFEEKINTYLQNKFGDK